MHQWQVKGDIRFRIHSPCFAQQLKEMISIYGRREVEEEVDKRGVGGSVGRSSILGSSQLGHGLHSIHERVRGGGCSVGLDLGAGGGRGRGSEELSDSLVDGNGHQLDDVSREVPSWMIGSFDLGVAYGLGGRLFVHRRVGYRVGSGGSIDRRCFVLGRG